MLYLVNWHNAAQLKSSKIVLSKSIFYVKNQPIKKKNIEEYQFRKPFLLKRKKNSNQSLILFLFVTKARPNFGRCCIMSTYKRHNVWVNKTETNWSSDTLLWFVLFFLTQTLQHFHWSPFFFLFFLIKASYFWIPKVYTKKWANFRLSNHLSKIQIFRINSLLFITGQNWRNAFRRGNSWRKIWLGSSQWHFVTSP